jgi:hypothetical protein
MLILNIYLTTDHHTYSTYSELEPSYFSTTIHNLHPYLYSRLYILQKIYKTDSLTKEMLTAAHKNINN